MRNSTPLTLPRKEAVADTLSVQYRPQDLDQFFGNEGSIKSLRKGLDSKRPPRAYIFTGPSGCGKTTLARILANHHHIPKNNIVEIDAASFSGIDDMRRILETVKYVGSGANRRIIIIDEAHGLSKQAWSTLLKPIEEAREGLYWVLCTTEDHKIPVTIKTRCHLIKVKPLDYPTLTQLVQEINDHEEIGCSEEVIDVLVNHAKGSPRLALKCLEQVQGVTDEEEAKEIILNVSESAQAIDLIRLIVKGQGFTWERALGMLKNLEDQDPESIRLICLNYVASVMLQSKSTKTTPWLLQVLESFSTPYYAAEKMAPLLLAIGQLCYSREEG